MSAQGGLFEYDTEQPWAADEPLGSVGLDEYVTLVDVLNQQAQVWNLLLGHADAPVGEQGRPNWRASSLGYCLRRQCLWRAGVAETRREEESAQVDKQRKFAWGNDLHAHMVERTEFAGLLIAAEVKLEDTALEVTGNMDMIWGGRVQTELPKRAVHWSPEFVYAVRELRSRLMDVVGDDAVPVTVAEIKTTNSWTASRMHAEGPRFDHRMQLGTYALLARRNLWQLPVAEVPERYTITVLGRDAVRPFEFGLPPGDADAAEDRIGELNTAWASGEWPDCTCGSTKGMEWEQRFCPYLDPDDPTSCCGQGLLERLEASLRALS